MWGFSVTRNAAITTGMTINYSRANFFSSKYLNLNRLLSLHIDLKNSFSLKFLLSLVLKSTENVPKYGKIKVNSLLGTMKLRYF